MEDLRERGGFDDEGVLVPLGWLLVLVLLVVRVEEEVLDRVKLGRMEEARRWTRPGPSEGKSGGEGGGENREEREELLVEVDAVVVERAGWRALTSRIKIPRI